MLDILYFLMCIAIAHALRDACHWLVGKALAKFYPQHVTQLQILLILAEGDGCALEVAEKMKSVGVGPKRLRWLRTKCLLEEMQRIGYVHVWMNEGAEIYGLSPLGYGLVQATRDKLKELNEQVH